MVFRRALLVCVLALPILADERLWIFNQFPARALAIPLAAAAAAPP